MAEKIFLKYKSKYASQSSPFYRCVDGYPLLSGYKSKPE